MILKIKDKDYPLQWGMGCMEMFCDAMDCDLEGLEKVISPGKDQIKYLTTLILSALKNGSDIETIYDDFEIKYKDLQKAMDDWDLELYKAVIDDFKKSRYMGKTMAEHLALEVENIPAQETPGVKKKSRSVKS